MNTDPNEIKKSPLLIYKIFFLVNIWREPELFQWQKGYDEIEQRRDATYRCAARINMLERLENTTTQQLIRFAKKLNYTRKASGKGRSEREMNSIFRDTHFPIDGFSTYFRSSFPVIRLTIKHWEAPWTFDEK